jgi:hypothetical protein
MRRGGLLVTLACVPLRRAGCDENFIAEVTRVMEYSKTYELYKSDLEYAS